MNNELHLAQKRIDHIELTLAVAKAERDDLRTRRRARNGAAWYQATRSYAIEVHGIERANVMYPPVGGIEAAA